MNAEERKAATDRFVATAPWRDLFAWIAAGKPDLNFGAPVDTDRWIDEEQARRADERDSYWRSKELRDSGDIRAEYVREI